MIKGIKQKPKMPVIHERLQTSNPNFRLKERLRRDPRLRERLRELRKKQVIRHNMQVDEVKHYTNLVNHETIKKIISENGNVEKVIKDLEAFLNQKKLYKSKIVDGIVGVSTEILKTTEQVLSMVNEVIKTIKVPSEIALKITRTIMEVPDVIISEICNILKEYVKNKKTIANKRKFVKKGEFKQELARKILIESEYNYEVAISLLRNKYKKQLNLSDKFIRDIEEFMSLEVKLAYVDGRIDRINQEKREQERIKREREEERIKREEQERVKREEERVKKEEEEERIKREEQERVKREEERIKEVRRRREEEIKFYKSLAKKLLETYSYEEIMNELYLHEWRFRERYNLKTNEQLQLFIKCLQEVYSGYAKNLKKIR